jgi:hypothetical protein
MRFLQSLIKINDIYYISEQLKNINKNYELFLNINTNKFEVHDTSKPNSFVVSYNKYPDQNLILKLIKSLSISSQEIFNQIEKHNHELHEKQNLKINQIASDYFNEIFNFSEKITNEVSAGQIKKILEKGQ